MSLDNLVDRTLEKIVPDRTVITRLIRAAERNTTDAQITQLSTENRFDVAYKAIMQLANAALQSNGYRALTSKPGHHMTMIQTLNQTIGLESDTIIVLDALRKQRNIADYTGEAVTESAMRECIVQAEILLGKIKKWVRENRPDLLDQL